jgi:hypothetical protein
MRSSKQGGSSAGIYFAHNTGPADLAGFVDRLLFVQFDRNLLSREMTNEPANVLDCFLVSRQGEINLEPPTTLGVHQFHIDRNAMDEPWRYLQVEVSPQEIRPSWRERDGSLHLIGVRNEVRKTVSPIPIEHVQNLSRSRRKFLEENFNDVPRRVEYKPGGGLGLYVQNGVADFRNVVYEPLPQEEVAPP